MNCFIDITEDWLNNATPNSHEVLDALFFQDKNGIKYFVDGKNVVLDYSVQEKEIALWLENTFGGEIYMIPRVNIPEGISTPDYFFKGEYWDLKEIRGNGAHTLDSALKKNKNQAYNFIFDITKSKMTNKEVLYQIKSIYFAKDRKWVQKIIFKNDCSIKIYKRKEINHQS